MLETNAWESTVRLMRLQETRERDRENKRKGGGGRNQNGENSHESNPSSLDASFFEGPYLRHGEAGFNVML